MGRQHRDKEQEAEINSDRDCHTLRTIVSKNHRTTAAQVTAELNIHLEDPVFTETV
jgi:hypothetical protein